MEELQNHRKKFWQVLLALLGALIAISVLTIVFTNSSNKSQLQNNSQETLLNEPIIRAKFIATGLDSPTGIVSTGISFDKRLLIVERGGKIQILNSSYQLENTPFLDISSKVLASGEMGLLGLAFSPDYQQNGLFYVNYIDKQQNTIIASFKVSAEANVADLSSEKVLLKLQQPYTNHNGGDLVFGPDGYLYAALGDGGSGGDPENRAQNKDSLFGKILRLDVSKGDPYSIPESNPFVNQQGAKPEIWAYGLRNPWRISFDSATGDLYIADVGQGKLEEVSVQPASSKGGENYGWRCYEGSQPYQPSGCLPASSFVAPIFDYTHEEGRCSITGGYVYRGSENPALVGKYFYADFCSGQLYYAIKDNDKWAQTLAAKTPFFFSAFGLDNSKELYFADFKSGSIYKLVDINN